MAQNNQSKLSIVNEDESTEVSKQDKLIEEADKIIGELVYDKQDLRKAYNYYLGVMDKDQYAYIEDVYGLGNASALEFIPLVKRHIDVLIGEHIDNKFDPKVTCKDYKTLENIRKMKQDKVSSEEMNLLKRKLSDNIHAALFRSGSPSPYNDEEMKQLIDSVNSSFISEYEVSAQYLIEYIKQSREVFLEYKRQELMRDYLITGQCYYQVAYDREGYLPTIEVHSPLNVFFKRNFASPYVRHSQKAVIRRYMSPQQVIAKYGRYLSDEEIEELEDILYAEDNRSGVYYIRTESHGLMDNLGVIPSDSMDDENYDTVSGDVIEVYEVQWLVNKRKTIKGKRDFVVERVKVIKLGKDIHIVLDEEDKVIRSMTNPTQCTLDLNGIYHIDKNGKPYSLVFATMKLQDKYNLLHFYRDNLIATSGTKGQYLDVSMLPDFLGDEPAEKIIKWIQYKKAAGLALLNTAQEGFTNLNTIYNGFDDTVGGQAIQAIQLAIDQTEYICSALTGVYRERLNQISQRDAVTNVQVGIKQSAIITRQYHAVMDDIISQLLLDSIDMCKITLKDGYLGSVLLNGAFKVFEIKPEYFTTTDYDIHIESSGDIAQQLTKIEMMSMELIKGGATDVDLIVDIIGAKSLTDVKQKVVAAIEKKKQENNQLGQLQQQVGQYDQAVKQYENEISKLQQQIEQLNKEDKQLKRYELDKKFDIENKKIAQKDRELEIKDKQVQAEVVQLYDENSNNNEIRNY